MYLINNSFNCTRRDLRTDDCCRQSEFIQAESLNLVDHAVAPIDSIYLIQLFYRQIIDNFNTRKETITNEQESQISQLEAKL